MPKIRDLKNDPDWSKLNWIVQTCESNILLGAFLYRVDASKYYERLMEEEDFNENQIEVVRIKKLEYRLTDEDKEKVKTSVMDYAKYYLKGRAIICKTDYNEELKEVEAALNDEVMDVYYQMDKEEMDKLEVALEKEMDNFPNEDERFIDYLQRLIYEAKTSGKIGELIEENKTGKLWRFQDYKKEGK